MGCIAKDKIPGKTKRRKDGDTFTEYKTGGVVDSKKFPKEGEGGGNHQMRNAAWAKRQKKK